LRASLVNMLTAPVSPLAPLVSAVDCQWSVSLAKLVNFLTAHNVRSIDHLALLPERVRSTAGGARGVDNLGVATRLSGLSLAGKAAVWDLVTQVAQARESAGRPLTAEEVIGTLPPEALLR